MEVTKLNFDEVYPKVCKSIDDADFIAFDTEFTGLGRKGVNRHMSLDTPEERYTKLRNDITQYTIIQFGLSTFKFDLANNRVQTATYCFYLGGQTDASYRYDSSSVEFLAKNGFNFNKLFKDGLPFMSLEEEEADRKKKQRYVAVPKTFQVKTVDSKNFMAKTAKKLEDLKELPSGDKLVVPFKNLSSFDLKLFFNNIATQFPTYLIQGVKYNVEVTRFETKEKKEEHIQKCYEESLRKRIGFGLVARKILEANKPIVGHNPIMDVFHIVDKIVAGLPETCEKFKTLAKANLPVVYDTKLIAKDPPFATKILNSALINVYDELYPSLKDIQLTTEPGSESYSIDDDSKGKAHDAGYDAFMTGICFLAMLKRLQGSLWMKENPFKLMTLNIYANKLNLMYSHDIPYFDLVKEEPFPSRSNIFLVECPDTWNENDIKLLFSDLTAYKTIWENDTKVYVVPLEPEALSLSKVTPKCQPNVFVSMYKLPTPTTHTGVNGSVTKHALDDVSDSSSPSSCKETKRIKNEESAKMSEMTLNPSAQSTATVAKDHFEVPNDWN